MSTFAPHAILDEKRYSFMAPSDDEAHIDELAQLKIQLEALKSGNPFLVAEMALDLQIERLRVVEVMKARDNVLNRLADAYVVIRQKNEIIERMQEERENKGAAPFPTHVIQVRDTAEIDKLKAHIATLEATIGSLSAKSTDPPPCYEENILKKLLIDVEIQTDVEDPSPTSNSLGIATGEATYHPPVTDDASELVKSRNAVLATIPLPDNPPDATLTAIVIPPPVTLHEFLNMAPSSLKNVLSTYRILHNSSTTWCPDREEHGFMYVPMFKCSTNPKIATAHRWSAVDPVGRMAKPTECFYHKEGVWYYAGLYKGFKMDVLTTKEWSQLPSETTSVIIKETIAARKNSSPQNTYETSQLYSSGALKVACVGLQCVGFNQDVYRSILEHSAKLLETKWKPLTAITSAGNSGSSPSATTGNDATASSNITVKAPKAARHAQRPMVTHLVPTTPVVPQAPAVPRSLQATPTISELSHGVGLVKPLMGSAVSSIWHMNAGSSNLSPSLTGPGGSLATFVPSGSPLSATSKVFESARKHPTAHPEATAKA
ncbi:hypothetical protein HYPSUDRAFT_168524 [Hypholoma sublateritium FD-334 SS-4]|uniref:DUF6697 domain-containing protein n=1 Tax=Hypholoma sublateritium (strain FD-334 SS-4) TaxID=945553 RepID=A0A0D2M7A8_HYPSF|nr:hypothetical protein HYPSUDRAFT_168524 [Hypholoma sublateritium FD-334 SS-4]